MTLETFFEKFDQFFSEPSAVKKMRELILLLARDGKVGDTDANTWERVQLGTLGEWGSGGTPLSTEPRYYDGNIPWLIIGDLNDGVVTSSMKTITEEGIANSSARMLPKNVLLIAMYGSIGKLGITGIECATNQAIAFCKPDPRRADLRYLFYAFMGLRPKFLFRGQGLAQKNINQRILRAWEIGLPPLAEQKRIVAKVDELMTLCDRLEAQQQERGTQHAALTRASLARFADAPTPANLDFLFHPSYAIPSADLRKSILTLAVQGKLVPQDPNDEPAEELAAELARMKTQLLAGRRIRNQKVSGCPSEDDFPFEIPASWKWVRLGHAVTLLGGYAYESGAYVPTSSNQIIRLGNVKSDALLLDQKPTFIPDALAEQTAEYAILEGDILVTMTGTKAKRDYAFTLTVKRADLGRQRLFLNQRVGAIRPFQRELVPLINVFLKSDQLLDLVFATATGTANQANIGTSSILDLPFPIPPLAEQRRIVAKVEQLMALVDALEAQLADSRDKGQKLLEAVVSELTLTS